MDTLQKSVHKNIDALQSVMADLPQITCPLIHIFTPGMYIREIFMPAGTVVISKIHNTTHPFIVSMGTVAVFNAENGETEYIEAPYTNITKPGTRRVLNVLVDTIWTTFHCIDFITGDENLLSDEEKLKIVAKIEDMILSKREGICHS